MKQRIEDERKKARQESQTKARQLMQEGKVTQANKKFMEGIEITNDMIHLFIQELKRGKVDYVVSPYESDAQLAFLYKSKMVDLVITEDSDLLPYGVEKVLFKMDPQGNGIEIDMTNIDHCCEYIVTGGQQKFTQEMLLQACILSGCDYHQGVAGVGYKTALQIVKQHHGNMQTIL